MEHVALSPVALTSILVCPESMVFESVFETHRARIFRFALASPRDRDAAETITQDCFLRAHRAWDRFRNECSLESWLMKITVNLIRDYARNRSLQFWRRAEATAPDPGWAANLGDLRERSPEEHAIVEQRLSAVWKAAAKLTERQRTVFLLRFVEETDPLEIVASTGMKEGTVKTHLFRALNTVRLQVQL